MRAEAAHRAEMVNQVLFGETFTINQEQEFWLHVTLTGDSYEGWVQKKQVCELTDDQYHAWLAEPKTVVTEFDTKLFYKGGFHRISFGTAIPKGAFSLAGISFDRPLKSQERKKASIAQLSYGLLDVPYLWGGKSASGLDCSGFTQLLFKTHGIQLLRDSSQQATQGGVVDGLQNANAGDLAFFTEGNAKVSHVGLLLSKQEIIHASGKVKLNRVDEKGIIARDGAYSHQMHSIRRMTANPHLA